MVRKYKSRFRGTQPAGVRRIGSFKGDPVLINLDAASEILAEMWLKQDDLANNAMGQSIHRLNEAKAPNLQGTEPFYKRYPQLYPGLKPGSKPTAQQNRQIARAIEEFLFDAGLTTGADVGEADPLRRGVTAYSLWSGTAIEDSDKLYPPRMRFTQAYRDMVDSILNRRDALPEWMEWREEFSRRAEVSAEKQRITQMPVDRTPEDIAHSKKGHKLSVKWLTAGFKQHIFPDAMKRIQAGLGRIDFDDPVGVVHQTPEEYETKSKLHKDRPPGRPSNQSSIRLDDDSAPRIPLGDEKPVQTKGTKKALAKTDFNWDTDFNYEPTESQARVRSQNALTIIPDKYIDVDPGTDTVIRYQVRRSIVDSWNDALGKIQHYGDKEGRNFKKILLNEVHQNEKALGISLNQRTTQKELYDALDMLQQEKIVGQDKTIKGGKLPSLLHDGFVWKYIRPTEKGRNRKTVETALKINSREPLRIAYGTYSTGKRTNVDPATGKSKSEKTASDFAKTMTKYGADKTLKALPFIGPIVGFLSGYFSDPDPLEAHPGSAVGRGMGEAARSLVPLPFDAYPVGRAQLTDQYTPEELKQMRIEAEQARIEGEFSDELEQTMSPKEMGAREAAFADIEDRTLGGFLTYEPKDDRIHYRPPTP